MPSEGGRFARSGFGEAGDADQLTILGTIPTYIRCWLAKEKIHFEIQGLFDEPRTLIWFIQASPHDSGWVVG